jgi:hypothetical protein
MGIGMANAPVVLEVFVAVKVLSAVNAGESCAVSTLGLVVRQNLVLLDAVSASIAREGDLGVRMSVRTSTCSREPWFSSEKEAFLAC